MQAAWFSPGLDLERQKEACRDGALTLSRGWNAENRKSNRAGNAGA